MKSAGSGTGKALSIIIVNWNASELLQNCLKSIQDTVRSDHEVIVVDNNSSDGSVSMIKSAFPRVILLEEKNNLGFSKANNLGFLHSRGEHVLFLNPDTVLTDNAVDGMVDFIKDNKGAGIVGPKILKEDKTVEVYCKRRLPDLYDDFLKIFLIEKMSLFICDLLKNKNIIRKSRNGYFEKTQECECLSGCCMLFRREIFDRLKGFDEQVPMYLDDIDISLRSRRLGLKNMYIAESSIIHHGKGSTKKSDDYKMFDVLVWRARLVYYKKNFGAEKELMLKVIILSSIPFLLVLDLIALPLHLLKPGGRGRFQLFKKHFGYSRIVFKDSFNCGCLEY